jgi:tetratricopeptide (TPR) repeat protein
LNELQKKAHEIYQRSEFSAGVEVAISGLSELLKENEDDTVILSLRSNLYSRVGKKIEAKYDLNKAIKANPSGRGLYYDRGVINQSLGQLCEALSDFCEAVNLAYAVGDEDLIDAAEHHVIEVFEMMRGS